jgi:alkanesulfonate monooxygenase SsuD/methylene tetrahydromethanopterin reductase-like flavin-dependent oxidoreductase (luciferase family)
VGEHVVLPVEYEKVYPADPSEEPPEYAGLLSSPIVALARAAAVTTTLRVGTGVCLLPLHEPISFAKDISTLDADSGGRFLFGVGAGWMREETEIMGGDFDRRLRQIRDQVAAMKALSIGEEFDWVDRVSIELATSMLAYPLATLVLLIVGGNDTTRNSISGGVLAMDERPAEYDKLRATRPEYARRRTPPVAS